MRALRNILGQVQKNGMAIGHFNIADLVLLKAVFASARELKVPVLVGASEGERDFMGVRQTAALVRSLREECAGLETDSHSSRSVLAGSILATLRAGAVVATRVTAESVSTTTRMVGASYTPTP